MKNKEFRVMFDLISKRFDFKQAFGGWFKESDECIAVLDLQKSNFGNYFDLNIKTYIQGIFGFKYKVNKKIIKNDTGDLFTRQPKEFNFVFDLDFDIDEELRKNELVKLFNEFIIPEVDAMLTRDGIRALIKRGDFVLPSIKKELDVN